MFGLGTTELIVIGVIVFLIEQKGFQRSEKAWEAL
jgi:hypothetical protein